MDKRNCVKEEDKWWWREEREEEEKEKKEGGEEVKIERAAVVLSIIWKGNALGSTIFTTKRKMISRFHDEKWELSDLGNHLTRDFHSREGPHFCWDLHTIAGHSEKLQYHFLLLKRTIFFHSHVSSYIHPTQGTQNYMVELFCPACWTKQKIKQKNRK